MDAGCSMDLEKDYLQVSRNFQLAVAVSPEDGGISSPSQESPARRRSKIFRLRTVPEEKMDAKALGRDVEAIYKAMFED